MPAHVSLPGPLRSAPFPYRNGIASGLSDKRLRAEDLPAPFRGTRDPTRDNSIWGLCRTYATQMDERCFFSSLTAAALMSIPLPTRLAESGAIHVAIVAPHRGLEGVRVIGHKVQLMGGDYWIRDNLRMSTPARTWCELGVPLSIPELVAAGDFIIHYRSPLASHVDLADAVERYPDRRGKRKLRAALALLSDRAESPMESVLRAILVLGGIAGLEPNYPIQIASKSYRLDLAIPNRKVAIEYHGDYHRERTQWRRDMSRRARIEADGWKYIEVNGDDLRDPVELVRRIKSHIR